MLLPHLQLAVGVPALQQGWAPPRCPAVRTCFLGELSHQWVIIHQAQALATAPALKTHMQNLSTRLAWALGVTLFAAVRDGIWLSWDNCCSGAEPCRSCLRCSDGQCPQGDAWHAGGCGEEASSAQEFSWFVFKSRKTQRWGCTVPPGSGLHQSISELRDTNSFSQNPKGAARHPQSGAAPAPAWDLV